MLLFSRAFPRCVKVSLHTTLFICGLSEYTRVAAHDMTENGKGRGKIVRVRESMGGSRGGERLGVMLVEGRGGGWRSWITMAGVQGWLIVSDTLQF